MNRPRDKHYLEGMRYRIVATYKRPSYSTYNFRVMLPGLLS